MPQPAARQNAIQPNFHKGYWIGLELGRFWSNFELIDPTLPYNVSNWAPSKPANPDNACVATAFNSTSNSTGYNSTSGTAPAWQWANDHCTNSTHIFMCRKMGGYSRGCS